MEQKPVYVTIVEQMDPAGHKIGGMATCIKNFIKFAPDDFRIGMIGVTSDKRARPAGAWQEIRAGEKAIRFLPVLSVSDENRKNRIPLSFKFFLRLLGLRKSLALSEAIVEYHRIEPALALSSVAAKQVLFLHGHTQDYFHPATEVKWKKTPWLYYGLEKRVMPRMDAVFCVRQDGVESLRIQYPPLAGRFSFLPTWVDEEIFFPGAGEAVRQTQKQRFLTEANLARDSELVIFVGRLEDAKDPDLLIAAFCALARKNPRAALLVVGQGVRQKNMADQLARSGLSNRSVFTGNLPQENVADLMRIADVLLLTSHYEGMPRSALEALACGLPVVCCEAGEVRRVVKEGVSGTVVGLRNPGELADAMSHILSGKGFSREGCVATIQEYTAPRILEPLYQRYRELSKP